MDRRAFLRRSALVAAGVVAADQLEIVERLGWTRRFFPGFSTWSTPTAPLPAEGLELYYLSDPALGGMIVTMAEWDALLHKKYVKPVLTGIIKHDTSFRVKLGRVDAPSVFDAS